MTPSLSAAEASPKVPIFVIKEIFGRVPPPSAQRRLRQGFLYENFIKLFKKLYTPFHLSNADYI